MRFAQPAPGAHSFSSFAAGQRINGSGQGSALSFDGGLVLARILSGENGGGGDWGNGGNLQTAFQALPSQQQEQIRNRWGSHLNEIFSLSRETDVELFHEALFHLGQRLERAGRVEQAGLIYSTLLPPVPHSPIPPFSTVPAPIQQQAQERVDVLRGGGTMGLQMEHMGRGFARSALDPGLLLGATGMGLFGKGIELVGMRYLAGANFFRSATGIARTALEFAPRATGFALEATAFPFAINGANELLGRPVSWAQMDHRIYGSWFFLGGMRVGGRFGASASRSLGVPGLQTVGSIAGVGLGHGGEVWAGLKEWQGFSNFAVETFGTWANLQVAGRFSEYVFNGQISRMQRAMDASIESRRREGETERGRFREWADSIAEAFNNFGGPTPLAATPGGGAIPSSSRRLSLSPSRSRLLQEGKSFMTAMGSGGGEPPGKKGRSSDTVSVDVLGRPLDAGLGELLAMFPHGGLAIEVGDGKNRGQILQADPRLEATFGYTAKEATGMSLLEFFPPEDREAVAEVLGNLTSKNPVQFENLKLIAKDGRAVRCDVHGRILRVQGQKIGLLSIHDVTKRHQDIKALREAQLMLEAVSEAVVKVDEDNLIQWVNPAAERIFGYKREEMIGQPLTMLMPERYREAHMAKFQQYLNTGERTMDWNLVILPGLHASGREIPLGISFNEYTGGDRERYLLGVMRDITEKVRAEEALRESEAHLRALVEEQRRLIEIIEASTDYISMATLAGKIIFNNQAIRLLRGLPPDVDLAQVTIADNHPPWALEKMIMEGVQAARRDGVWVGETALRHVDGHEVPVSQMIIAHRDSDGNITRYSTIIRDLTDIKQAEADQIEAAKFRTLQWVSGGLAHDINGALVAIKLLLEMAGRKSAALPTLLSRASPDSNPREIAEKQSSEIGNFIQDALSEADRIGAKIHDFRQLASPPKKGPPIKINHILSESFVARHAGDRVEIQTTLTPDPFLITMPEAQILDIIQNLAKNARDAMTEQPNPKLLVGTENVTLLEGEFGLPEGNYLKIFAQDNGRGMDEATQRKIFQPFFSTKGGRGEAMHSGLGLAMVQKYVQEADGVIRVESEPGVRTTFEIYLPEAAPALTRESEPILRAAPKPGDPFETPILVIDDEPTVLRATIKTLKSLGFKTIHSAKDGEAALELYNQHPDIGLVISDINLPGKKGDELIALLREKVPNLPFVLWTGALTKSYTNLGERSEVMQKPVKSDELFNVIQRLLGIPPKE